MFSAVVANGEADPVIKRDRDAEIPSRVILIEATLPFDNTGTGGTVIIKGAQFAATNHR